jgi:hypothetical protein
MPDAPTLAPPAQALKDFMGALSAELPNPQIGTPANIPNKDKLVEPEPPKEPDKEPPKEPQKEPAKEPAREPVTTEDKWPRSADQWKEFKKVRDSKYAEYETRIKTLESERDDAKKTTATPATESSEYKSLQEERDALSERLKVVDVTQHPRFQAYFGDKRKAQIDVARSIVGKERADQIAKILEMPEGEYKDTQLDEFTADLTSMAAARIGGVVNSLAILENERQGEIKKSQENFRQMQETEAKRVADQGVMLNKAVDSVLLAAQNAKNGHPAFQKREGQEEWNKAVDQRVQVVRNLFSGKGSADSILRLIVAGTGSEPVLEENLALRDQLAKAQEQIKSLSAAQPNARVQNTETTTNGNEPRKVLIAPGSSPRQAMAPWVANLPRLDEQ